MSQQEEDIIIRTIPNQKVLSRKIQTTEADIAQDVQKAFMEVTSKLLVAGGKQSGKKFIRRPFLKPYQPDNLIVEICVPTVGISQPPINWELFTLEGHQTAACLIHKGPYLENTGPSYQRLTNWLNEKGLEPVAPIREIYLHEPFMRLPETLETEIVCPLSGGPTVN